MRSFFRTSANDAKALSCCDTVTVRSDKRVKALRTQDMLYFGEIGRFTTATNLLLGSKGGVSYS